MLTLLTLTLDRIASFRYEVGDGRVPGHRRMRASLSMVDPISPALPTRTMKFTIDTQTLSGELFKLQGVVSTKTTMPILSNALIDVEPDGTIRLHATDLELSLSCHIRGDVARPGRAAVRAKDLYEAVKNLRSPTVTIEREDSMSLAITAGTVRARLVGMDPIDFPKLQSAEGVQFISLPIGKLVRMIDRTLFSVSTDEGRPNLNGALLKAEADRVLMVSTDGHRLSKVELETPLAEVPAPLVEGVIVPRKALSELRRTLDLTDETIGVGVAASNAVFQHGNTTMFVRFIDGTFPSFRSVMPVEKEERRAIVDRQTLMSRIKFVSLFANSKTYNLSLKMEDGACTISAQDPDKGECQETVPVTYSGPPVKAGYNYKYLLDVLSVVDTEQVSIEVIDTLLPTVLHELASEGDEQSLFIVMPMRL